MTERFGLYFAPARESALWERAEAWLARPDLTPLTVSARRYGFHATLKAPMELTEGATQGELLEALDAFARNHAPVDIGRMEARSLGGFTALTPMAQTRELQDFAAKVMRSFDRFRAPLTELDRMRRNTAALTPHQIELLERWGYQYVLDEFTFHMTLTDLLPTELRESVIEQARSWFVGALAEPVVLDRMVLFYEPGPGAPFQRLDDYPLKGRP